MCASRRLTLRWWGRAQYLGAAGTTTLLHRDVYASNSISTNVAGRKRWHLFPPATVHNLHRDPADLRSELVPDVRAVDRARFAGWERARAECVVVEQEAGETIFVPSGWYRASLRALLLESPRACD